MAQLYRKSALEKISSPEQLDKALTVISPLSWIALAAVTVMIVVTIIWSVVGTIPMTVAALGVVSLPKDTVTVFSLESGEVRALKEYAQPGTVIREYNTPLLQYETASHATPELCSDQVGVVTSVLVKAGDKIDRGTAIIRLRPLVDAEQVVVCYVKLADASKLKPGMEANVDLTSRDSQAYGHMRAKVISIDSFVSKDSDMLAVLGSQELAGSLKGENAAVVAVILQLKPDAGTVSGYYWSAPKGAKQPVPNGMEVQVSIVVEEVPPITKLFYKLKELWGD